MTEIADRSGSSSETGSVERLRSSLGRVRARGSKIPVERWLALIGAALVGIGIPLIILGWYGAAHTPYTFEQIPYMISGGLLGLALTILGGLFYFAYWLTRQVHETRRASDQTEQVFRRIDVLLSSNGHSQKATLAEQPRAAFVTTGKGSMFHRPDCVVVKGRSDVRAADPNDPNLQPCKICDPLGADAQA